MLAVEGLSKRFGGFLAVNQVSFEVRQGEILGLIGPNGSGKSTTFNLIAGTLRPSSGSIRFEGEDITSLPAHTICRLGIARTFQIPRPFRKLSLLENVTIAAHYGEASGITRAEAHDRAVEALGLVGLPTDAAATTSGLGAAALKKLELARALATKPRLLLADESLGGLELDGNGARRGSARKHSQPHGRDDRLGRAHHGRADAHRRPRHRARPW